MIPSGKLTKLVGTLPLIVDLHIKNCDLPSGYVKIAIENGHL